MQKYVLLLLLSNESTEKDIISAFKSDFASVFSFLKEEEILPKDLDTLPVVFYLGAANGDHSSEQDFRNKLEPYFYQRKIDYLFCTAEYWRTDRKLVCFDMDSCLIQNECIDEIAAEAGVSEQVSQITKRAMERGLDFQQALRQRLELVKGLPEEKLCNAWKKLSFAPGAVALLKCLKSAGYKTALLSGGFTYFAYRVATLLDMDFSFSNTLEVEDNKLTGCVVGDIVDGIVKKNALVFIAKKLDIPLEQVVAIGDGANDRWMLQTAGLGVAYHGKEILRKETQHHLNFTSLRGLAHFLRLPIHKVEEGDSLLSEMWMEDKYIKQFIPLSSLQEVE